MARALSALFVPLGITSCSHATKNRNVGLRKYYSAQPILANGLMPHILAEMPDEHLDRAVAGYIIDSLTEDYWDWYDEFANLRPGFRAIFATLELEGEVDNGGFSQFFANSFGYHTYDALDGCRLIGALETAVILEEAIALDKEIGTWDSKFPDTGAPTIEFADLYDYANFDEYDARFFDSNDNLSRSRIRYIREHPWEFYGPPIAK